jgi:hypothetical protein
MSEIATGLAEADRQQVFLPALIGVVQRKLSNQRGIRHFIVFVSISRFQFDMFAINLTGAE